MGDSGVQTDKRYLALEAALIMLEAACRLHGWEGTTLAAGKDCDHAYERDKERIEIIREMMREIKYGRA